VVGFIAIGRHEDRPAPVDVMAIYTRKAWWGIGLGSRLMEIAVGNQPASLWVLENNERAKAFYRRKGFVEDGTVADEPFFDVTEIRMVRR
jgi:GNAT superfamily N-acetyltransferase